MDTQILKKTLSSDFLNYTYYTSDIRRRETVFVLLFESWL